MLKKILLFQLIIVFLVFFGSSAQAQVRDSDIAVNISPQFPGPNQLVKAQIQTHVTDLNKAYISWSVNNERLSAGIGKTNFSFNTQNFDVINLTVAIDTATGQSVVKTRSITPAQVDLIWEAVDSYAPPFYKGKTLVGQEGTFKVVAVSDIEINGKKIHGGNLSYTWSKDEKSIKTNSGWGKDSFVFKNSYLDNGNNIKVFITDILNGFNMGAEINLKTYRPEIVFYEKDPVLGLQTQQALRDDFFVTDNGVTIAAIPYFISPKDLSEDELIFKWQIGQEEVNTPDVKNELNVRPESGRSGETNIELSVENLRALFLDVKKEIDVAF